jgi:cytochrome P450
MSRCGLQCKLNAFAPGSTNKYDSIAGSDSTSGALRAIFYFLMKNPEKMAKLTRDIDTAFGNGVLSHPVQYNQAKKLPYLNAVIQESLRLFPPFGVPMPRYAPATGLNISGYHIPAASKVRRFVLLARNFTG